MTRRLPRSSRLGSASFAENLCHQCDTAVKAKDYIFTGYWTLVGQAECMNQEASWSESDDADHHPSKSDRLAVGTVIAIARNHPSFRPIKVCRRVTCDAATRCAVVRGLGGEPIKEMHSLTDGALDRACGMLVPWVPWRRRRRMGCTSRRRFESRNMTHVIQSALTMLRAGEWVPVTAARVLIGIFFCISGGTKLFVRAQFGVLEQTLVQSHSRSRTRSALFVAMVEFACGAGLALGLLTPLCAAMLMGDMIVAIATNRIHSIQASGVLAWLDDFLYLPEVLYTLILVWLIFSGPGRYSVDGLIAWRAGLFGVER